MENIRNITVSGPIGVGTTTLGKALAKKLNWKFVEGGEIFKDIHKGLNLDEEKVAKRPDEIDVEFDKKMKMMLLDQEHQVIESHLSGYNAQGIPGVFKIRLVCEKDGIDQQDVRVARVAKRDDSSVDGAKKSLFLREKGNIEKYQRVYNINPYTYADLYDLTINTFDNDEVAVLQIVLDKLKE